jgi:hypothetical protein
MVGLQSVTIETSNPNLMQLRPANLQKPASAPLVSLSCPVRQHNEVACPLRRQGASEEVKLLRRCARSNFSKRLNDSDEWNKAAETDSNLTLSGQMQEGSVELLKDESAGVGSAASRN